jgi:hypothetical protein
MEATMKKAVLVIATLMLFAMVNTSLAEEGKWSIQIEPMWMDVKGNDVHVGDVFRYREEVNWLTGTYTYSTSYEPINLDMKDKLTLRGEITYRKNQWGLGISGWWFNTDDSVSGRVTTPPLVVTPTGFIEFINGVRMWDHTIIPVINELEASFYSPVDYWAKNDIGVWTIDIFGIRTLAEKKDSNIDLTFGLKLGSPDNDRSEGQRQHAFIYDAFGPGLHFDNLITLESKSKADYGLMAGPGIGLSGKAKYKAFGLEGLLNQSLLIGRVEQSGNWRDIDDIWVVTGPVGGPFTRVERFAFLDGNFPFSKKETVALPVTEAKLKLLYDVNKNVSIGIGGFASMWWNAPVAPKWSMPGDWVGDEGTGWRLQESTLVFYGGMLALNLRW